MLAHVCDRRFPTRRGCGARRKNAYCPAKAYRVILDLTEQEKAEVIVMGVHGKGALKRRLFGSTTHHVIREARCPVLTLRA
jgi:hypothetical protein